MSKTINERPIDALVRGHITKQRYDAIARSGANPNEPIQVRLKDDEQGGK